ncbi:ADP-ribose pyrophosphatase [Pediococcus damnosus]|uniref:ADP-ribose pyrophosphatase n=1 Tax=Pediococcus damnosus TaxID=51663 RepID=A0A0R2HPS8_9LACO|nr:NUDIX hydrolase [Pediococcus damnosus]AMV59839.1 ADP-ribose pyrophosphatase [Pediococcus damnosus]AMV61867.1 ADP-ribose pyrophosphatase [Pediococcus damnosus]AMV64085.1 ADP-ribose pyrophosphatase [Pediococcus damnosus]AMV66258.1 ADP-ribose pyrophosphatase [Pediococcus damnosus]AMV68535.1 ADP-ribose pyrophosphatase [Pediococcus damnosus]
MNFEEKVVKNESRYKGAIIDVYQQTVKLPNGDLANRDVVLHQNAIAVLAITKDNKAIFEKQWRAPIKKVTIEIPAGKVEDGETAETTAVRELNEETRYQAGELKRISGFYSTPGFANEYMTLYMATDLHPVATELPQDKDEHLQLFELSLSEALAGIADGSIEDAKTVLAIYYWQSLNK